MTGTRTSDDRQAPASGTIVGLVGFGRALAEAGLSVPLDATTTYLDALRHLDVADPAQVYWAGRAVLCRAPDDIDRYDAAFVHWFGGTLPTASHRQGRRTRTARIAALTRTGDPADGSGDDSPHLQVAADDTDLLRRRDIAELTAAERAHLGEMLTLLRPRPPRRPALRSRPSRRGPVDPSRTLRDMLAAGGEPVRPRRHHRATRPRRVVLLVDVSGSMTPYADALLRFAHVVTRAAPASTETFSVGTRLTRLSRALRAFLDRWGRRGLARGAVVVIFSDGWERGDATLLGEQMAQLRRLAHRVLWVNPHAGGEGYEPIQSGISKALPHIDRLLAGHSLATLEELLEEVHRA